MTALSGPTFGLDASEELDVMDGLFFNELSDLPVEPGSAKMYGSSGPQPVVDTPITDEELIGARAASGTGAKESKPKAKAAAGSKPKDAADLSETRRARNREHARRSRCRKKLIIESLQQSLVAYQGENERLREFVREKLGAEAAAPSLEYCAAQPSSTQRRSFVITDPTLPDNPIVFASGGFLSLTGYKLEQVLGRNCRFLQGPRTDARAVGKIREAIKHGTDVQICLLNYKIDSTTFWNHFFIAAPAAAAASSNFLGVQIEDDGLASVASSRAPPEAELRRAGGSARGS
ncbi:PAS domain-containing protein [Aureococcus anophagefferens]|nr:PAS domain-containing protein [Aureococcus anophagefferens]